MLSLVEQAFVGRDEIRASLKTPEWEATIGDKIVETLYINRATSENKRIRTPPLSPPFKVGVFVVFYR